MLLAPRILCLQSASVPVSAGLAGAGVLFGSATDDPYPFHWSRRLSLRAHRGLEVVSFLLYLGLPAWLGLLRFRRDRTYFLVLFAASLNTHALTDWRCQGVTRSPQRTRPN